MGLHGRIIAKRTTFHLIEAIYFLCYNGRTIEAPYNLQIRLKPDQLLYLTMTKLYVA
jgi:hypothetical protein